VERATIQEVERLLDRLRVRRDPMAARRFACECVRGIWAAVEAQSYVSPEVVDQCRRAVELTERSITEPVPESDLRAIDFEAITDAGDGAFLAAAHVGWNLFAPVHGLHEIDEFEAAKETAFMVACLAGTDQVGRQIERLRELVSEEAWGRAEPLSRPPNENENEGSGSG
jgi:hypothetical protein